MLKIEGRERITTEQILTTLFKLGFDRIDPVFYTYVLGSIKPIDFELERNDVSSDEFKQHVRMDGPIYVLKKGINHDNLYRVNYNEKLNNFLEDLDYEEIIYKKLEAYNLDDFDADPKLFCEKEINIIKEFNERIKACNEMEQKFKEMELMKIHTDYITWLIDFIKKQETKRFYDADCVCYSDKYSGEDKENIKKLSSFIRVIGEYAYDNGLEIDSECVKVKYKDTTLEVGEFSGQGTVSYAKIILDDENGDEAFDYQKIVNYYSRIASNVCPPPTLREGNKILKNVPSKKDI